MAQVKKFQSGGKLTINGKDYTIDQLNEYMNSGGFSSQERAALAGTIQSIANGASRTFDRNANSISGEGVTDDFTGFYGSEKRAERNQGRSTRWANRQARRNSDHHIVNSALERLGGIEDYYNNKKKKEEEPEKTRLYKGSDANGFYESDGSFLEGPENMQNISRITTILDAIQSGDLSKYDLQDWEGDTTLSGLTDWYAAQNGGFNREEFLTRLRENKLTNLDWEVLSKMGFVAGTPVVSSPSDTFHEDWNGNKDAASKQGVYFTKDKDGNWIVKSNDSSNQYLGSNWYAGGLDFLAGTQWADGIIGADGRLYTRGEVLNGTYRSPEVAAFLAAMDAKDWRSWYDLANASGVRFSGDRTSRGVDSSNYGIFNTQFNPNTAYNEHWQNYFSELGNQNYDIADLSNTYSNLNGRQILAYVDPTGAHDAMGIRSVKYVVRNADGTYKNYDSESALQAGEGLTHVDRWWGVSPAEFGANPWETIGNRRYSLVHVLNTDGNQQNVILRGEDGRFYLAKKDPNGSFLSPTLIQDEALLQEIIENPQNYNTEDVEDTTESKEKKDRRNTRRLLWSLTSSKSPLRKEGGAIPKIKPLPEKFQYGGNLGKTTTIKKEDSTEGKRTDITATHKANGSDGGLTDAEKMQIGAAIGDLAGVGLSFVPGAHFLGSFAGLGATATRFAADVKKDGFQGKDFWSALGGAALDVASLVPILGTGVKTAKAVKALKAAATPIMKVLSVVGAVNGAQAMGKVIRGEEVTSEDITAILSGLGSATIAGKQLKDTIGDARLARMVESKSLSGQKIISKPTAEIGGKKMEIEIDALKDKSLSEVETMLKNKVKATLGKDFKEGVHDKDLLDKFQIKTETSKKFSIKNLFKKGEKAITSTESAVFSPTEKGSPHSVLRYTLSPRLRAQQLGYNIGYKQSSGNLGQISKKEYKDAMNAVMKGNASGKQIALVRRTSINPKGFSFELGDARNINSGWGWPIMGRSLKYDSPTSNTQVLDELPGVRGIATPRNLPEYRTPIVKQRISVDPTIPKGTLNEFEQLGFYDVAPTVNSRTYSRISLHPLESGYFVPTNRVSKGWFMRNFDPMFEFKKGGKITKHKDTSIMPEVPNYLKDVWIEIGRQLYQPTMVDVNNPGSSISSIVQSAIADANGDATKGATAREDVNIGAAAVKTNYGVDHAADGKNPTKATSYNYSSLGSQKSDKSPRTGLGLNIAGNIAGSVGKAATAYAASKRQMDLVNDMKPFQEQQAPEHSFRYRDPGIDLAYNNAINQQQSYARNFKTANPELNAAVGLDTANQTAQLELERGLKKAQFFGEQQAQHQNLLQQEAQNRTDVVNRNAERANQMDAYKRQMKGAYIAQNQGIIQGLIDDISGIGQQATAGKKALAAFDAKNMYADNMSGLRNQYQTGINNGSIASGTSFDDWAMANHKKDIRGWQRDYLASQYQYIKKGGRIRPASEQIKIDNEKARHKAIAQLSKQAFELLKMALS